MEWDTRALNQEACDAFTSASTLHKEGKAILDGIARIGEQLRHMDGLESVCICSCNDSTWRPDITVSEIKSFVRDRLECRRENLRAQFNRLFGK